MAFPAAAPLPRRTGTLAVGDGHTLAWQEYGAPQGRPALVLHGGPGSFMTPALVRGFDLARWRVVGFDQRGCGASTPCGSTAANTTKHLLRDIEALRQCLAAPRWTVVGGSWGATLALAYAARHPQAVDGLLLRGLFVPEEAELRWFFHEARPLARPAWDALAALAPGEERHDLLPWLAAVFAHGEPRLQVRVARAWIAWEQALCGAVAQAPEDLQPVVDRYRIQSHYLARRCWLGEGALHACARNLAHVPVHFLHGANDVVCRPAAARVVHGLVAGSRFELVPQAGHDPLHPAMAAALRSALQSLCAQRKEPA